MITKIRKSKRQSAWSFMRRNRIFRVGDVMIITQMSQQNLRLLIGQLVKSGYIEGSNNNSKNKPLTDKTFKVIKAKEVVCPVKSPSKYVKKDRK